MPNTDNRVVVIVNPRRVVDRGEECLFGRVYGHPTVMDGHRALTSKIVRSMSPVEGVVFVYTLNRRYLAVRTQPEEMPMEMWQLIDELAEEMTKNENQTENTQERVAA